MSKTRAKGNRTVRKIIESLEKRGWFCDNTEKHGKFTKHKDLFSEFFESVGDKGGFDLIAIHPEKGVKFIQAKTNRPGDLSSYTNFSKYFPSIPVEMWTWYDRKGFVIHTFNRGERSRLDFRKP